MRPAGTRAARVSFRPDMDYAGVYARLSARYARPRREAGSIPATRQFRQLDNSETEQFRNSIEVVAVSGYRRVILKLSGEALSGPDGFGIHQPTVDRYAQDIVAARNLGVTIGVVVGGGNVLRGVKVAAGGVSRPTADAMGMLATVINALVLEAAIERAGVPARSMSALTMPQVCETYERARALRHLDENKIVVFAGGTGNPFFTTDTTAVLRAAEMGCDAVLKATNVDGVYTADPKQDPHAKRYEHLTHDEAFKRELKVMDATAFALARENHMPIIVFSILEPDAIKTVLSGCGRATVVGE
jgi:uridylate kinase